MADLSPLRKARIRLLGLGFQGRDGKKQTEKPPWKFSRQNAEKRNGTLKIGLDKSLLVR
jgi:hypothetical protein